MDKKCIQLPKSSKWIKGYEGKYAIDTNGDVLSYTTGDKVVKKRGSINGYPTVSLVQDGFNQNYYVHKIFAEAFLAGYEDRDTVYFKDGDRNHISLENLSHSGTFNMLPFDSVWIKGYEGLYSMNENQEVVSWVKGYPVQLKGSTLDKPNGKRWKIYSLVKDGVVRTHYFHEMVENI